MKQIYTKQKSANRHPKKFNFNEIERMSVSYRREQEYSRPEDIARHEAEIERRKTKESAPLEIIRPYGYNGGFAPTPIEVEE